MLALAMLAFGALVWGIFLLGRESLRLAGGRAGGVRGRDAGPVPVAGRARLRGHPVPGAGGRARRCSRRAGRGAARRCSCCSALAGLLRPEAWLLARRLLALPAAGARPRPRAARLAALVAAAPLRLGAQRPGRSPATPLHSLTFTRDTAETLGRPQGIENVPEMMPRRLGEILRWVPLVGGTAGFFLALRFARDAGRSCPPRWRCSAGSRSWRSGSPGLSLLGPLPVPAGGDARASSSASPRWAGSARPLDGALARVGRRRRGAAGRVRRARRSPTRPTGSTACATASSCAARSRTTCAT